MTSTTPATDGIWGTTTTTALDRLAMIRNLVQPNGLLTDASRAFVLNLTEHINPTQDWGATGWVYGGGRDYLIAVLTDGNPTEAYWIDMVNTISAILWKSLAP